MYRLSASEEIAVLRQIKNKAEYIDSGSSRAVFGLDENRVVKMAIDTQGQKQNGREIEIYRGAEKYGNDRLFGEIYAYGSHIIICARMVEDLSDPIYSYFEDENWEHDPEYFEEYLEGYKREDWEKYQRALEVATELASWNGETQDNAQIGQFADGSIRAYDYGYDTDTDNCVQVGNVESYCWVMGDWSDCIDLTIDMICRQVKDIKYVNWHTFQVFYRNGNIVEYSKKQEESA